MKHEELDLEGQLRAGRSIPRAEFAEQLAETVRSSTDRRGSPRLGSVLALAGLIVVAVASFGGMGYASSSSSRAKNEPTRVWILKGPASSSAAAQYSTSTTTTSARASALVPKTTGGEKSALGGPAAAPAAKTAQLPFTGLSLWVPLAVGLMLISLGLVLRTRGRRRDGAG
jgi:hypothetical protein